MEVLILDGVEELHPDGASVAILEPPQAVELPALALGRSARARGSPGRRCLARARDRRGPASVGEPLHLHDPLVPAPREAEQVTHPYEPGRLRRTVVHVYLAARARGSGEAPRLEEARRPEPLVHAERIQRIRHAETVS